MHKAWFPDMGRSHMPSGCYGTLLGTLSPINRNASVLRVVTAFFFMVLRKTDQKTAQNDIE